MFLAKLQIWEKHYKECNPNALCTFGIVDVDHYDADNGILIIGKETRNWQPGFHDWLYTMATENENLKKKDETKYPLIWYNLGRWAKYIHNQNLDKQGLLSEKKKALAGLQYIAFTNVNKVYGGSSSKKEFWNLIEEDLVQEILQEEIRIISPRIIVVCGEGMRNYLKSSTNHAQIIEMPHPSARRSKEELLAQLESQLKGC